MDTETTMVIFRKWKQNGYGLSPIIALFPTEAADISGNYCTAYAHVGQHHAAHYWHVIEHSVPATPEDYKFLKTELETHYDYKLDVRQRASQEMHDARREAARQWRTQ